MRAMYLDMTEVRCEVLNAVLAMLPTVSLLPPSPSPAPATTKAAAAAESAGT